MDILDQTPPPHEFHGNCTYGDWDWDKNQHPLEISRNFLQSPISNLPLIEGISRQICVSPSLKLIIQFFQRNNEYIEKKIT